MRYSCLALFSFSICAGSLLMSGCGGTPIVSSKSPASTAGPAPTVVAVGEQVNGVAPNRKQEVQFSEAMDPSTINTQSFQVTSSGKPMPGTVSYDPDFDTASFLPNPALQTNATYTVTISAAAASAGGVPLASQYSYAFTTRSDPDTSPISVNTVSPAASATCVSATTPITITFDEAPDASTLTAANLAVSGPGGAIAVKINMNVTTTQVILTPTSPLPSGTITVTVNNVADLAGMKMAAPYMWSFSTTCGPGGGTGREYLYFNGYLNGGTQNAYAYAIDPATGSLSPVPGMPFLMNTGAAPTGCGGPGCFFWPLADPAGRFLFYGFSWPPNPGFGSMTVDPATGALANDDVLVIPGHPPVVGVSMDPQGRFMFESETETGSAGQPQDIAEAVIDSSGKLSFAPGQPFSYPGQQGAVPAPAVTDQFVFTPGNGPNLYGFSIDQTTGALSSVSTTAGGYGNPLVTTPSGKFLYADQIYANSVSSANVEIVGYRVNADGSLTQLPQAPQQTPDQPEAILIMSPNGNFLYHLGIDYAAGNKPEVRAYAIDQNTGSLSLTAVYTNIAWSSSAGLAIDPAVKYVYVPEISEPTPTTSVPILAGFAVDANTGALTPLSGTPTPLPANAVSLAIVRPQ